MRVEGYQVQAAAEVADPEKAARSILDSVATLRPQVGEAALAERLAGKGYYLRWRTYRSAFVLNDTPVGPAHLKVYAPKGTADVLIEALTRSRGATSWKMGLAIVAAGIPTPQPLLLLIRKPFRLHRETILVTRAQESTAELDAELRARIQAGKPVRKLLRDAARLTADLHRAGFFHGDCTAWNIMASGPAESRSLWFIDLDRTKNLKLLPAPLRHRIQALDLRLLLHTTDMFLPRRAWLRFLVEYCRQAEVVGGERKKLIRRNLAAKRGKLRLGARIR